MIGDIISVIVLFFALIFFISSPVKDWLTIVILLVMLLGNAVGLYSQMMINKKWNKQLKKIKRILKTGEELTEKQTEWLLDQKNSFDSLSGVFKNSGKQEKFIKLMDKYPNEFGNHLEDDKMDGLFNRLKDYIDQKLPKDHKPDNLDEPIKLDNTNKLGEPNKLDESNFWTEKEEKKEEDKLLPEKDA